jgi:phage/plasmid-associated DNA primase
MKYLTNCRDMELPDLKPNRLFFSFKNGIFSAEKNLFYPYIPVEGYMCPDEDSQMLCTDMLDQNLVTTNFIKQDFDFLAFKTAVPDPLKDDPLNIPTPNIQRIMDHQQLDDDVSSWFYAICGRMIFPVGYMDKWEIHPMTKGTAGTGKSTLWKLVSLFFKNIDVGNLMAEGQKSSFGVEHLLDKFMFICFDIGDKLNLSPTTFNQMVSGETVTIDRKHLNSVEGPWTAPGAFAGNCFPPWEDEAGSMARRFMVFLFTKYVTNSDARLFGKMTLELPAFMQKCVSCYHQKLRVVEAEKGNIWKALPEYFWMTRGVMQRENNPLRDFVDNPTQCQLGPEFTCDYRDFRMAYRNYCTAEKLKFKRLSEDVTSSIFAQKNITNINIQSPEGPYLQGIQLLVSA